MRLDWRTAAGVISAAVLTKAGPDRLQRCHLHSKHVCNVLCLSLPARVGRVGGTADISRDSDSAALWHQYCTRDRCPVLVRAQTDARYVWKLRQARAACRC